jgi:hypothetical protein
MGTSDAVPWIDTRDRRSVLRRVAIAVGSSFLVLTVLPISVALVLGLTGGSEFLAVAFLGFGLLGLVFVLAVLPIAVVVAASIVVLGALSTLDSYVTERRLGVLHRVEAIEETRWWGSIVRPSERLSFLDPRTAEERFEAALDDAKSAYVAGDISEAVLERRLDRLFGLDAGHARAPDDDSPSRVALSPSKGGHVGAVSVRGADSGVRVGGESDDHADPAVR